MAAVTGHRCALAFHHVRGRDLQARQLLFTAFRFREGLDLEGSLLLTGEPEESMNIAVPFTEPGHFSLSRKVCCMRVSGEVILGRARYIFDPDSAYAVLYWGRGAWPPDCSWYWSAACGETGGVPVGFTLGCGFGEVHTATENAIVYGGKIHKLSHVKFQVPGRPGREDWMSPWRLTDDAGRLELDFVPVLDRTGRVRVPFLSIGRHQVFGRFTGRLVLDDGTQLKVENLTGFAERVVSRW